jgi:uncharacterized membrane protein YhhN
MLLLWTTLTFAGVCGLLVAEYLGSRVGVWITKPLTSTGFVGAAVSAGAAESGYGNMVLVALGLSWLGDVLLIPKDERVLRAGILSFLLGHVAYAGGFLVRGVDFGWMIGALIVVAPPAALVLRWLAPHVPPEMKSSVSAYVSVITLMVATAAGTVGAAGNPAILAGALAFYLSDLSVARDRFVAPSFVNRAWGLPHYYAAQIILASTVS